MKMDAMRRQGTRSDLDGTSDTECRKINTAEQVEEECGLKQAQVRKYVRLTELIPEFMDYVDQKRIPIIMGVELSNFDKEMQKNFYEYFRQTGVLFKEQLQAIK